MPAIAQSASPQPSAAPDAWQAAARLHRGVNVLGYDPLWTDPAKARFQPRHFTIIRKGGFDFVRIVLQSFKHMDARNRLDRQWLATLDRLVAQAGAAGLSVILDEHDFNYCADDAAMCETKLIAFWQQVGAHFANAPANVLFEVLNEPHGALNGEPWNALIAKVVPVIRATNPRRTLIIGPSHWNSLADLPLLKLPPDDRNIIVTVHYYEPFRFTHQGARWAGDVANLHGIPLTADDERRIVGDFDTVAAWSKANDRPVELGEFGAYDRSGTPIADRARYVRDVRQAAESHGMPWAYWQFDGDFVVYDIDRDAWVEPIRRALMMPSDPTGK
ncbi:MAG: glycoside hydrolase family 5 protein [Sphingomonas sp.]|nr:glycoside hydrolase family 5 protein [Sphingomonas sp.]